MPSFKDLTGKKFHKLTVLYPSIRNKHKQMRWMCRCDCGAEKEVRGSNLINNETKSCGCHRDEMARQTCIKRNSSHGLSRHRVYKVWDAMRRRCNVKHSSGYKKYGAKGIKVCEKWMESFNNFITDMGLPPTDKHTLDRIDPRGNYEPDNCRWVTMKVQQNNRTNNRIIEFQGKSKTIHEWADFTGIPASAIRTRIDRDKWSIERALTEPSICGKNQSYGKNLVTYNGKSQTIEEWAKEIGINRGTLQDRLNRRKWPVEQALNPVLVKGRGKRPEPLK